MQSNLKQKKSYQRIITQIDSLKNNFEHLICNISDKRQNKPSKSVFEVAKSATSSRHHISKNDKVKKCVKHKIEDKQNISRQGDPQYPIYTVRKRVKTIENQNHSNIRNNCALEEQLRQQRQKRKQLERLFMIKEQRQNCSRNQKYQIITNKYIGEYNPRQSIHKNSVSQVSKTRDQAEVQSFLLGNLDQYITPDTRQRRKKIKLQAIDLVDQLARPDISTKTKQNLKNKLFSIVDKWIYD